MSSSFWIQLTVNVERVGSPHEKVLLVAVDLLRTNPRFVKIIFFLHTVLIQYLILHAVEHDDVACDRGDGEERQTGSELDEERDQAELASSSGDVDDEADAVGLVQGAGVVAGEIVRVSEIPGIVSRVQSRCN